MGIINIDTEARLGWSNCNTRSGFKDVSDRGEADEEPEIVTAL
jgi:hypothetical protein